MVYVDKEQQSNNQGTKHIDGFIDAQLDTIRTLSASLVSHASRASHAPHSSSSAS